MPGEAAAPQRLQAECGAKRGKSLMVGGRGLRAARREPFAVWLAMASLQGACSAAAEGNSANLSSTRPRRVQAAESFALLAPTAPVSGLQPGPSDFGLRTGKLPAPRGTGARCSAPQWRRARARPFRHGT